MLREITVFLKYNFTNKKVPLSLSWLLKWHISLMDKKRRKPQQQLLVNYLMNDDPIKVINIQCLMDLRQRVDEKVKWTGWRLVWKVDQMSHLCIEGWNKTKETNPMTYSLFLLCLITLCNGDDDETKDEVRVLEEEKEDADDERKMHSVCLKNKLHKTLCICEWARYQDGLENRIHPK